MPKKYFLGLIVSTVLIFQVGCQPKAEKEMSRAEKQSGVTQAAPELPAAVTAAINRFFAGAEIDLVETEKINGITLYDIEFKENRGEIEVAGDGTVIDITMVITWQELPSAVADTIKKVIEEAGAKIMRLEKAEVQAEIKEENGKKVIVRITPPIFLYEAEINRDNQRGEITVNQEGKIIEGPKWENNGN